jgi:hypothetical protein
MATGRLVGNDTATFDPDNLVLLVVAVAHEATKLQKVNSAILGKVDRS